MHAGNVDDYARFLLSQKVADSCLGSQEGPTQVNCQDTVKVSDRRLVRVGGDLDAGVVDQDVQAP